MDSMQQRLKGLLDDGTIRHHILSPRTQWKSLRVRYETPHVDRLWMQIDEDHRLMLHRIHPCEKALFHPHPWPSAVFLFDGPYEMGIAQVPPAFEGPPTPAAKVLLAPGSYYEMLDPNGWHYVKPVAGPSYSVMLVGKPWQTEQLQPGRGIQHDGLSDVEQNGLLAKFSRFTTTGGFRVPT